jgi:hypothetical protein
MRERRALFVILLSTSTFAGASDPRPQPVSPGRLEGSPSTSGACPVFSFTGFEEAQGYELVALQIPAGAHADNVDAATVALHVQLPAGASTWSPPLDDCLQAGSRYLWAVRARIDGVNGEWSQPSRFEVPLQPSSKELDWALEILDRHRRAGVASGREETSSFASRDAAAGRRPPASEGRPSPLPSTRPSERVARAAARKAGARNDPAATGSDSDAPTRAAAAGTTTSAGGFRVDPYVLELSKLSGPSPITVDLPFDQLVTRCADGDGCELRLIGTKTSGQLGSYSGAALLFLDTPQPDYWRLHRYDEVDTVTGINGDAVVDSLIRFSFGELFACGIHDDGVALFPTYQIRLEGSDASECLLRIDD